jgi:hypothetical protein
VRSRGHAVTIVELRSDAVGQSAHRRPPTVYARHTAVVAAGDKVDDECNLPDYLKN